MGKKILLVEDMLTNIILAPILENAKYQVVQTSSFAEAKNAIEFADEPFFIAIIDLNLEDTQNGDIIDYLDSQNLRTIVYSDPAEHSLVETHIDKNIVDYVIKQTSEDSNYILKLITNIEQFQEINILIVDNLKETRDMLESFIKPLQFKTIFQAEDGIEALECTKQNSNINLVITNYNMPKMDGFELTQNLRKRYSDNELSIISISSEINNDQSAVFFKYGVSNFLTQPYSKAHLNSIIHNEMDNLFLKQKNTKYKKDLTSYIRKLKTDTLSSNQEIRTKVLKLEKENLILENKVTFIQKEMSTLEASNKFLQTKLQMQAEKLGQKKEIFKSNEIDNS